MIPSPLRILTASLLLAASVAEAQKVYTYTGMGSSFNWTNTGSWVIDPFPEFPNSAEALVVFGELQNLDSDRVNMLMSSTLLDPPARIAVGAIVLQPELVSNLGSFFIRNSSTTTRGTLELHGLPWELDGEPIHLLVGNFGVPHLVAFTSANASFDIDLRNPGVIVTAPDTTTEIRVPILGAHRIRKVGEGHLSLSGDNTITGIDIIGGTLTFGSSASLPAAPSSATPDHIVVDGATLRFSGFGTTLATNRGITFTEKGGAIEVTSGWLMGTNSRLIDINPENPGPLRKTGTGNFTFGTNSVVATKGTFTIEDGRIFVSGSIESAPVEVIETGTIGGIGTIGGSVTVRDSGRLWAGGRTVEGITTIHGPVVMEAGTTLSHRLYTDTAFDIVRILNSMELGGAELFIDLRHQPADGSVYILVDNAAGPGAISGQLSFDGVLLAEGDTFTVATEVAGTPDPVTYTEEFTITYNYNGNGFANSVAIIAGEYVPPPPPAGYASWRIERFGNDTDPAGEPEAQPVGQLAPNLIVFALGLDVAADPAAALPVAVGEGSISFTRRIPSAVRLVVEATSGNPGGAWDEIAVLEAGASAWSGPAGVSEQAVDTGLTRVTVTDPASGSTGTRLIRVRASIR